MSLAQAARFVPFRRRLRPLHRALVTLERRALYALNPPMPDRLRLQVVCGGAQHKMALVAPDFGFAYVIVPKAANTTVRRILWRLRGVEADEQEALHAGPGPYLGLDELSGRELRHVLHGEGVFRFTFVRNPYARLLSAYRDKVLNLKDNHPGGYDTGFGFRTTPSFAEFAARVAAQQDEAADWHWLSQHRCAMTEFVRYDLIGKVETFEADMAAVLTRIGADPKLARRAPRMNRTEARSDAPAYDAALAEVVHRRFRKDFETFGYDPESWKEIR